LRDLAARLRRAGIEQQHRHAGAIELACERDAGRTGADDAHGCAQRLREVERARVDDHRVRS
jgi:hypothetical protein